MTALRKNPPATLAGLDVVEARDYVSGEVKNLQTGEIKPTNLPVSDVLYYATADGSWACVRPSGTEPKIKIYFGANLPHGGCCMDDVQNKLDKMAKDMLVFVS